jgi:hypothetical protein
LKKKYPAISAVVLAAAIKRSHVSVQKQLRELGISKRKESSWTGGQLRALRKLYPTEAVWKIANLLDKTSSQIKHKAAQLKLKK